MAAVAKYNCSQKVAFAGVVLGFCFCLAGMVSPFWIEGEVSVGSLLNTSEVDSVIEVDAGLFWFCYQNTPQNKSKCQQTGVLEDLSEFDRQIVIVQFLASASLIMSLLCGVFALCKSTCCSKGQTVCHGFLTFLAGAAGVAVVVFIQQDTELLLDPTSLSDSTYGWSFYIYVSGSGLLILASFVLCYGVVGNKPENVEPLVERPVQ